MEIKTLLLFLYGCILGSFFNVVGLRIPLKKSIITPRSACPICGHHLKFFELIPVVSYLIQRRKCRVCHSRISRIYPIMELFTGFLFALALYCEGWSGELLIALSLISLFTIIIVSDIHYLIIPDKILIWFAGIFLLERVIWPLSPWWDSLLGAVTGFLLLLFIAVVSKGGMGFGDVKLFALLGFLLGFKIVIVSFFLSTLYGAFLGGLAIVFKLVKRRQPIPFGPFIAAGTLTAYFWGLKIIYFYIHIFDR